MKWRISCILIILILGSSWPIYAQEIYKENFEIDLMYTSDKDHNIKLAEFIQASLFPLGIKVNLIPISFSVLNHYLFAGDFWDIALLGMEGGNWFNFDMGCLANQENNIWRYISKYDDEEFVSYFENHSDLTLDDLYQHRAELIRTIDKKDRQKKLDELTWEFLNELLFYLPLVKTYGNRIISSDLKNYNQREGILNSLYMGAYFSRSENNPRSNRHINTYAARVRNARNPWHSFLFYFDEKGTTHPDHVIQWKQSPWVMENHTSINDGKYTFWMRDDAYMEQSNMSGLAKLDPYPINLKDWEFSYWIQKNSPVPNLRYQDYDLQFNYTDNAIIAYSIDPTIDDLVNLNEWQLYPEMYLNTTLRYNSTLSATPMQLVNLGLDPRDTEEFFYFQSRAFGAPMITFPYQYQAVMPQVTKAENDVYFYNYTLSLRSKYHYPSELDSPGGDFILHEAGLEKPYFFAYNHTDNNTVIKATTLPIDTLSNVYYSWHSIDQSYELTMEAFDKGFVDTFVITPAFFVRSEYEQLIGDYSTSNTASVTKYLGLTSGTSLVIDLSNPAFHDYRVRKAIYLAINRDMTSEIVGDNSIPWNNPVWPDHSEYNASIKLVYDYDEARDLMREMDLYAANSSDFPYEKPRILPITPSDDISLTWACMVLGIIISSIITHKRKNRYHSID